MDSAGLSLTCFDPPCNSSCTELLHRDVGPKGLLAFFSEVARAKSNLEQVLFESLRRNRHRSLEDTGAQTVSTCHSFLGFCTPSIQKDSPKCTLLPGCWICCLLHDSTPCPISSASSHSETPAESQMPLGPQQHYRCLGNVQIPKLTIENHKVLTGQASGSHTLKSDSVPLEGSSFGS